MQCVAKYDDAKVNFMLMYSVLSTCVCCQPCARYTHPIVTDRKIENPIKQLESGTHTYFVVTLMLTYT